MTIMNTPNRVNRLCDGVSRPNCVPIIVPIAPGIAKDIPCFKFTCPFLLWYNIFTIEFAATANADVPIAIWVFEIPTTYINNGTASMEPPPPIIPRVNPITAPDNRESKMVMMICDDTKAWSYVSSIDGIKLNKEYEDCINWIIKEIINK